MLVEVFYPSVYDLHLGKIGKAEIVTGSEKYDVNAMHYGPVSKLDAPIFGIKPGDF